MIYTRESLKIFLLTQKKEQKTLLRLKFTAKYPQREHNSVYKKWHRNIFAKFQHPTSATSHIRKPLVARLR